MKRGRLQLAIRLLFLFGTLGPLFAQSEISQQEYRARRQALRASLDDGALVLFGNTEGPGSESYFVFRQESNFEYLSGWGLPGAILIVAPDQPPAEGGLRVPSEILLLPPRNPSVEAWTGPQPDPQDPSIRTRAGFDAVLATDRFEEQLRGYSRQFQKVYTLLPHRHDSEQGRAVLRERVERIRKVWPEADVQDIRQALGRMRQVKSPAELTVIRRAIDCTIDAHLAAGRAIESGVAEYQVAALMKYTFERQGCTNTAFDPIIASGPRSTILHYTGGRERMASGDLVVLDVGAEYAGYSADISRTLPVNGKFTPRQREIYGIVLGAQQAVLDAIRPGMTLYGRGPESLHQIAKDYLDSHGKDRSGDSLGKYFIHGVGHTIGLDVHDLTAPSMVLQEGMVLAIEPGLYLPEENIGVRIEDNVLVTKDGGELLSGRLPRDPDEIERWMRQRND